ncbi:unnamed protein product [Ectocarpus sp. 4 AP-2014]
MVSTDRDALLALYNATRGGGWTQNANWNTDAALSRWHGVRVNDQDRVVELNLRGNNLSGPIPKELGALSALRELRLDSNQLSGHIPPRLLLIGDLGALQHLSLYNNKLAGSIPPELGMLAALRMLILGGNQLTGHLPKELGALSKLQVLDLRFNKLTGPIPKELGALSRLEKLWLYNNNLTGPIPPELGKLSSLIRLELFNNKLSGSIPPEVGKLAALQCLNLSNNQLTGSIPPQLGNLAALKDMWLGGNNLTGSVPTNLVKLSNLRSLIVDRNRFSGSMPSVGQLRDLRRAFDSSDYKDKEEPAESSMIKKQNPKPTTMDDPNVVTNTRMAALLDFEGDVVAWSFGSRTEILRGPGFELLVPSLGRNIPALIGVIGLCSGSAETVDGKQCLLHPVLRCLAGDGETFKRPLRLRFPVGDIDSIVSGSDCGSTADAELAYRVHLESVFSAFKREDASSEWFPMSGHISQTEAGVFFLEVTVKHFCDFGLRQQFNVGVGGVELVELPRVRFKHKQSHYHFANLGTEDLVVHIWGAARKETFISSAKANVGVGLTDGANVRGEAERMLIDVPGTGVYRVDVPGGPVGESRPQRCRVLDGLESPTVAWSTQKRNAPSSDGDDHEVVQIWGKTSMRSKHVLVFGPMRDGARPDVANLKIKDGRNVGRTVWCMMESRSGVNKTEDTEVLTKLPISWTVRFFVPWYAFLASLGICLCSVFFLRPP